MKIILKKNIKKLGNKKDIISVKPGYVRNYLIPKNIATIIVGKKQKKVLNNIELTKKEIEIEEQKKEIHEKLKKINIKITSKVNKEKKIFGSITPLQILNVLKDNNINIDRKKIKIKKPIKATGVHYVDIEIYKGKIYKLKVEVTS